jgi:hypothetical protein
MSNALFMHTFRLSWVLSLVHRRFVDCCNVTRTSRANHPGLDEPLRLKKRTDAIPRPSLNRARTVVGDPNRTALVRSAERAER